MIKRKLAIPGIALALFGGLALSGCSNTDYQERKEQQKSITLKDSLEKKNLKEKLERENDPSAIRYVYLMNFGQIVGYYVIEGKVSSSGSQMAAEQEFLRPCSGCDMQSMDSAQDDGTFGTGDPGIFFFLANGTMVSTTLEYIESDAPLPIDVPRLGGSE